ncbi:MAG: hypothetical protein Greene041619_394 [Candidatus Peregrinibacteria bacterium Greene0416_19]|nr:MAG: hypothetical protein Greene041619_394 [Candidatus Peregrinibacteria bacterium Greene0416_19]
MRVTPGEARDILDILRTSNNPAPFGILLQQYCKFKPAIEQSRELSDEGLCFTLPPMEFHGIEQALPEDTLQVLRRCDDRIALTRRAITLACRSGGRPGETMADAPDRGFLAGLKRFLNGPRGEDDSMDPRLLELQEADCRLRRLRLDILECVMKAFLLHHELKAEEHDRLEQEVLRLCTNVEEELRLRMESAKRA